jgi:hypothetical protein
MPLTPMDCWRIGWRLWLRALAAQVALMAHVWGKPAVEPTARPGRPRPSGRRRPGGAAAATPSVPSGRSGARAGDGRGAGG